MLGASAWNRDLLRRLLEDHLIEEACQMLAERADVQEDALEVRIRTEGLVSFVAELRQGEERKAA